MERTERVAVVTGGARGIGAEIVRVLAARVSAVAVFDVVFDGVESVSPPGGARVERFVVDVSDEGSVQRGLEAARSALGPIDIVVNNAGISPTHNGTGLAVEDTPLPEWNRVLAINLTGAFLMTKHTVAPIKQRNWGRIVNISSQTARLASQAVSAHYAAAKAGIGALTRKTALELGPYGATANCVAPGLTVTPMMAEYSFENYAETVPLKRVGQPSDIAEAIAFLVSDAAAYITGATLDVNGGRFMGL